MATPETSGPITARPECPEADEAGKKKTWKVTF